MKSKIVVLAGTRPEAIKLAPVVIELRKNSDLFSTTVCASGQHNELLQQAFADFDIAPDVDLKLMQPGQSLANLSARLFDAVDAFLDREEPDWLLVQGDTTTVMVAALCGYYRHIKIGHVEAGLRSFDKWAPFPEEVNRRVTGIVADKHFAPTEAAKRNLLNEGVEESSILVTGNTVIDALLLMVGRVRELRPAVPQVILDAISRHHKLVLITGHRRESFGPTFEQICLAIKDLALLHEDAVFVYPVHLNPNVRRPVMRILGECSRVILTDPLPYKAFVWLMDNSVVILTDSGGIQEEAPSLHKPVLVMREVTERPEGVTAGVSYLVGTNRNRIVEGVTAHLNDPNSSLVKTANNPYGDGLAAERIVKALLS